MVKVKFCGLQRKVDAIAACDMGVDALGYVFYPKSKRFIEPQLAQKIIRDCPGFVTHVGLWVNPTLKEIKTCLNQVQLNLLQFHGNETFEDCEKIALACHIPYLKAIPATADFDLALAIETAKKFPSCKGILIDSPSDQFGGSGKTFDWKVLQKNNVTHAFPVLLSGGLAPNNIQSALTTMPLYGVDVSSGIEDSPGIKSLPKMKSFLSQVQRANVLTL